MADIRSLEFLPVTKVLLISLGAVTLPCLLGFLNPALIYLNWRAVRSGWQIWRPLTNFFHGGGGFPLIFDTFCLYQTSSALEKDAYGDSAAYVWMNLVLGTLLLIFNSISGLSLPFLFKPYLTSLLYLWTKTNPTLNISVFGLVSVPARLYPVVLIVLDLVQRGPSAALGGIMGVLAGHLWWFLSTYLPLQAPTHLRRRNPLAMPPWFRRQFLRISGGGSRATASFSSSGRTSSVASGVQATRPRNENAAAEVRHRWGSGQKLGGSSL